jgi:PadR family transcriptional regulator, regulatory protein AphA
VLGLLAYWGPLSGYDIKGLFDHVLATMWGAAHSQIYHELRRMKELGWVAMEREEQESRPDRKVYQITQAGQDALVAWQKQPPVVLQLRDELLLKIIFGSFASPVDIAENMRVGIDFHEQRLLHYRQTMQQLPIFNQQRQTSGRPNPYLSDSEEDPYFRLVSRFAIDFENLYITWLHDALNLIEHGDLPPAEISTTEHEPDA